MYNNGTDYAQLLNQVAASSSFSPGIDVLTETHYDNYEGLPANNISGNFKADWNDQFSATSNSSYPYPQLPGKGPDVFTQGAITWTKTRVLNTNTYLVASNIYDDEGRVIQTQSQNITGGINIASTQYNWAGLPLVVVQKTENLNTATISGSAEVIVAVSKITYDELGRPVKTEKKQSSSLVNSGTMTSYAAISEMQYDEMGQLKNKKLGNQRKADNSYADSPLETQAFDYNIRGWLLGINRAYTRDANTTDAAATATSFSPAGDWNGLGGEVFTEAAIATVSYSNTNYFGFDLGYDKQNNNLINGQTYATRQLNGSITGMVWKSAHDNKVRKYDFVYDAVNRLTEANFSQYTNGSFTASQVDYSVKNLSYDANGNIMSMNQFGLKADGTSGLVDQLSYAYRQCSNKLAKVSDPIQNAAEKLGDFQDGANTDDDYTYDPNGNIKTDKNKSIQNIDYNFLNLPQAVTITNKGIIEYLYDAAGEKLQKKVTTATKVTVTTYLDGAVYQSSIPAGSNQANGDALQFFGMEEGRIRVASLDDGSKSWIYDYFLTDHLGNTRMVLTDDYHVASPILEANSYYPFGLKMKAISYSTGIKNLYRYQGDYSEFDEDIGWNEFALRNYDPQVGRFVQTDPFDQFPSPYTGMGNDPINNSDPSGGFSINFGTIGSFTGSVAADRALVALAGAAVGYSIDRLAGGNGWTGAAIGGGMTLAGTFIPPFEIGGAVNSANNSIGNIVTTSIHAVDMSAVMISHASQGASISYSVSMALTRNAGITINTVAPNINNNVTTVSVNNASTTRKLLDYIYDKEGRGYEDEYTKPPTDQPTKYGIDLATFKLGAKSTLGFEPSLTNLKTLSQKSADKFYINYYLTPYNLDKITNFSILNALFSQEPLGEARMMRSAKSALNAVAGTNYSINVKPFSSAEINSLNIAESKKYINTFGSYQYNSYMNLYNHNPKKYGAWINGWISRLNEILINVKYKYVKKVKK